MRDGAAGGQEHAQYTSGRDGEWADVLLLLGAWRLCFGAVGAGALFAFTGACLVEVGAQLGELLPGGAVSEILAEPCREVALPGDRRARREVGAVVVRV